MFHRHGVGEHPKTEDRPFAREIDQLRSALTAPAKGPRFILAIQNLHTARIDRARVEKEMRGACQEFYFTPTVEAKSEVERLSVELAHADQAVTDCRAALTDEREKYGPVFVATTSPHTIVAKAVVGQIIDTLEQAIGVLIDVQQTGAMAGVTTMPTLLHRAPLLQNHVRGLRRLLFADR